jgi:hypothetical protein
MSVNASSHARTFDAFLSHSSKDARFAASLVRSFEVDGLKAWVDDREVRFGELLRDGIQAAIGDSRVLVLVWSEAASLSRWVMAELFTAFHLSRFIVPCVVDPTPLPQFLQNAAYLDRQRDKRQIGKKLSRAVREAPDAPNEVPLLTHSPTALLQAMTTAIAHSQYAALFAIEKDFNAAAKANAHIGDALKSAQKMAPLDPVVLNLAGYQCKNDYIFTHFDAIRAGRAPKDPLLDRGERYFFDTLSVNPSDASAVNGLASILVYERELDAAEFFQRRAIALIEPSGHKYEAAIHDLNSILELKRQRRSERERVQFATSSQGLALG